MYQTLYFTAPISLVIARLFQIRFYEKKKNYKMDIMLLTRYQCRNNKLLLTTIRHSYNIVDNIIII